jgi:hypothetical protein
MDLWFLNEYLHLLRYMILNRSVYCDHTYDFWSEGERLLTVFFRSFDCGDHRVAELALRLMIDTFFLPSSPQPSQLFPSEGVSNTRYGTTVRPLALGSPFYLAASPSVKARSTPSSSIVIVEIFITGAKTDSFRFHLDLNQLLRKLAPRGG